VVLQVAVNVKKLCELGKKYPWPRPKRCLSCNSPRVWGHGYVRRYFEGYTQPLWVKRLRCPDCHIVYTLRPDLFYRGFRYSLWTILSSLVTRIVQHRFMPCLPRQKQQYWYKGLLFQAQRLRTVLCPDMHTLKEVISRGGRRNLSSGKKHKRGGISPSPREATSAVPPSCHGPEPTRKEEDTWRASIPMKERTRADRG
jgi:hypothetical protein